MNKIIVRSILLSKKESLKLLSCPQALSVMLHIVNIMIQLGKKKKKHFCFHLKLDRKYSNMQLAES